jgi:arylsulfatase A-like enzyme
MCHRLTISGFLFLTLSAIGACAVDQPNFLLIVADDMGWADVGYHGSPIPTPHLDRLCKTGVELDQHYVAPMCTPTRAALLTGRYWSRFGNTKPSNTQVLPFDTVTLASALKQVGYDTCITGKWHLGSLPKWGPRKFGFNRSHGSLAGGVNPLSHLYKHGPYSKTWHRNDQLIEERGHVTDLITREAVKWIEQKRKGPFFIYVPFTAVHTPFDEPQKWLDRCKHIDAGRRQYAACAAHLDDSVGKMIAALDRTGQRDGTLVVFFSDNGGTNGDDSSRYPNTQPKSKIQGLNTPLRGWKTQVYEGGIRTPALVNWPGRLEPRKVTVPLHVIDWMPTLTRLAGCKFDTDLKWDGRDIWPILTGKIKEAPPRVLYCQGVNRRSAALRRGDWKLIRKGTGAKATFELYDLARDPNEKRDLARRETERVARLKALLLSEVERDDDAVPR